MDKVQFHWLAGEARRAFPVGRMKRCKCICDALIGWKP